MKGAKKMRSLSGRGWEKCIPNDWTGTYIIKAFIAPAPGGGQSHTREDRRSFNYVADCMFLRHLTSFRIFSCQYVSTSKIVFWRSSSTNSLGGCSPVNSNILISRLWSQLSRLLEPTRTALPQLHCHPWSKQIRQEEHPIHKNTSKGSVDGVNIS